MSTGGGIAMTDIHRVHAALFDELERQGIHYVDVGKLTRAVIDAKEVLRNQHRPIALNPRCANGVCDE